MSSVATRAESLPRSLCSFGLRSYAQLVRLPNVFTALADICLGALATRALPENWQPFAFLLLASACLYSAGMVWNDYFDLEQDRRERPFRPLPSGRITHRAAICLGGLLLVAGVGFAFFSGWRADGLRWGPLILAVLLVGAILLYDAWLKRTACGPIGMGLCRFLDVLLGLTVVEGELPDWGFHMAAAVGVYIIGVTWFAQTEARTSKQSTLAGAASVMLTGLLIALAVPTWFPARTSSPLFPYLLVLLGIVVGVPVCQAIAHPTPALVQAAVKRAILGLVLLDAALATAVAGLVGLTILLLLLPALYLGRWIYST